MKFKELTIDSRSQITATFECGKSIKIYGELTTTPAFYADIESIKYWEEEQNEKLKITQQERDEIIDPQLDGWYKKGWSKKGP